MLFIMFSTVFFSIIFIGIGYLSFFIFKYRAPSNPMHLLWIGLFSAYVICQLVLFFHSLNTAVMLFMIFLGGTGLYCLRRDIMKLKDLPLSMFIIVALIISWFAWIQAVPEMSATCYDSDLYHYNIVKWANTYSTVPGLANLHDRFGLNSAFLILSAIMDNGIWDGRTAWFAKGIFGAGFILHFLWEIFYRCEKWVASYSLVSLFFAVFIISNMRHGLPYDDQGHFLNLIIVYESIRFFLNKVPEQDPLGTAFVIASLSFMSFFIKPIGAISLLIANMLILFFMIHRGLFSVKRILRVWLLPAIGVIGYVTENIIVTGYPLFPLHYFRLDLPWSLSEETVRYFYNTIRGWARLPVPHHHSSLENDFMFWFKPWLKGNSVKKEFWLLFIFPILVGFGLWGRALYKVVSQRLAGFVFMGWGFCNILYWFIMAPDLRFARGFPCVFLASGAACLSIATKNKPNFITKHAGTCGLGVILLTVLITILDNPQLVTSIRPMVAIGHSPGLQVKQVVVSAESDPFAVFVPIKRDQCGNSEIPCTPQPKKGLKLRTPDELGNGFYISESSEPEQPLARATICAKNFTDATWKNGIRNRSGDQNVFYFNVDSARYNPINVGDLLHFKTTGNAIVTKISVVPKDSRFAVFVTVDRPLDPVGDGFPNVIFVQ
jgi:hypothetical protein